MNIAKSGPAAEKECALARTSRTPEFGHFLLSIQGVQVNALTMGGPLPASPTAGVSANAAALVVFTQCKSEPIACASSEIIMLSLVHLKSFCKAFYFEKYLELH
jgi:hypothetical protein